MFLRIFFENFSEKTGYLTKDAFSRLQILFRSVPAPRILLPRMYGGTALE